MIWGVEHQIVRTPRYYPEWILGSSGLLPDEDHGGLAPSPSIYGLRLVNTILWGPVHGGCRVRSPESAPSTARVKHYCHGGRSSKRERDAISCAWVLRGRKASDPPES
ncbi:hypothetical protein MKZ38_005900 [Zalerion maritima]|uniref:Uncharacterized protein n=1 Tax=Zalerion maritima TaxID=339359 RepID=A0AAD5RK50_9PEZI|nr:hypothetical protein MKZ38_005900 [Zalerion maritima]